MQLKWQDFQKIYDLFMSQIFFSSNFSNSPSYYLQYYVE